MVWDLSNVVWGDTFDSTVVVLMIGVDKWKDKCIHWGTAVTT